MSESWRSEPWAQEGAEVQVARDRHGGELPEPLVGVAHGVRAPKRGRVEVHVRLDGGHHLVVDPSQLDCMSKAFTGSSPDADADYPSSPIPIGTQIRCCDHFGVVADFDPLSDRDDPNLLVDWHGGEKGDWVYPSNVEAVVNHPDLGSLRRELEGWIAEADELKSAGPPVGRDGRGPDPAYFLGWHGGRIDMAREVLKWLPK